jgi:hypothetical protein
VAADLKDLQSLKRPPRAPDHVVHLLKANRRRRQLPRVFEMHDKMAYAHAADFVAAESVGEAAEIPNARFFMAVERPRCAGAPALILAKRFSLFVDLIFPMPYQDTACLFVYRLRQRSFADDLSAH